MSWVVIYNINGGDGFISMSWIGRDVMDWCRNRKKGLGEMSWNGEDVLEWRGCQGLGGYMKISPLPFYHRDR